MRDIFIFCFAICFTSCVSITNWKMEGDITAFNQDGTVLRKWNNVILESGTSSELSGRQIVSSSTKYFGLNFIDPKTGKGVIIGNAVPYIIEYDEINTPHIQPGVKVTESTQTYNKEAVEKQIATLEAACKSNTEIINSKTATKEEKRQAKKDLENLNRELASLKNSYRNSY